MPSARSRCTTTDEIGDGDQPFAPDDRVSVVTASGEVFEHEPVTHAKGSWQKPLSRAELEDKVPRLRRRRHGGTDRAVVLFDQLWKMETLGSLRDLKITRDRLDA